MERREYTRIKTEIRSELHLCTGDVITGVTRDLSFGGAYLDCDEPIGFDREREIEDKDCRLFMQLNLNGDKREAKMVCHVVGSDKTRAGLRFIKADLDDYHLFRDFMLANTNDPEKLKEEIYRCPNKGFPAESQKPTLKEWLKRIFHR